MPPSNFTPNSNKPIVQKNPFGRKRRKKKKLTNYSKTPTLVGGTENLLS